MSNDKMSDELQIAIQRSPEYTAPSEELVVLRAEVAGWRRAVRWEESGQVYRLVLPTNEGCVRILGEVWQHPDAWWNTGVSKRGPYADRNTACVRMCELLGIPVVLPVGGG